MRATPAQLCSLDALIAYGTYKAAAWHLRKSERTVKRHIHRLREINDMTTAQLAWHRGRETWMPEAA